MADHVHRGGSDDRGIPEAFVLSPQDYQIDICRSSQVKDLLIRCNKFLLNIVSTLALKGAEGFSHRSEEFTCGALWPPHPNRSAELTAEALPLSFDPEALDGGGGREGRG